MKLSKIFESSTLINYIAVDRHSFNISHKGDEKIDYYIATYYLIHKDEKTLSKLLTQVKTFFNLLVKEISIHPMMASLFILRELGYDMGGDLKCHTKANYLSMIIDQRRIKSSKDFNNLEKYYKLSMKDKGFSKLDKFIKGLK